MPAFPSEEIYVAVVVKRTGGGAPSVNPERWAGLLASQMTAYPQVYQVRPIGVTYPAKGKVRPAASRASPVTGLCLALGAACLFGAGYFLHLALQAGR
ncbi:MAG TPA: hypothetical protein VD902_02735 [Symbiobacteriaceae bacterium]|nr:hypothetical protein [Symbiobacteriaceae bacterium]